VGWIDAVRTRLDDDAYKIRFTPRKPTSTWSAINIERVRVLRAEGRMTDAGLRAFAQRREAKSKIYAYEQAEAAALSPLEEAQFRKNKVAWTFFEAQPPGYRHQMIWRIVSANAGNRTAAAKLVAASSSARVCKLFQRATPNVTWFVSVHHQPLFRVTANETY
jgi:uncharacterized protein YdeI (YjbR/CyaY-like superfamily)